MFFAEIAKSKSNIKFSSSLDSSTNSSFSDDLDIINSEELEQYEFLKEELEKELSENNWQLFSCLSKNSSNLHSNTSNPVNLNDDQMINEELSYENNFIGSSCNFSEANL